MACWPSSDRWLTDLSRNCRQGSVRFRAKRPTVGNFCIVRDAQAGVYYIFMMLFEIKLLSCLCVARELTESAREAEKRYFAMLDQIKTAA
jgi:hypothetical protein